MIGTLDDLVAATTVYTDGSCLKNPGGPGGWAYSAYGDHQVPFIEDKDKSFYGSEGSVRSTTNNRMELFAIINGLAAAYDLGYRKIKIVSDSKYSIHAFSNYELNKKKKKLRGKKNLDLIKIIEFYLTPDVMIEFNWVKGHAKSPWNIYVDNAAYEAAKNNPTKIDIGYESIQ
jgi:ribonuclease HI